MEKTKRYSTALVAFVESLKELQWDFRIQIRDGKGSADIKSKKWDGLK